MILVYIRCVVALRFLGTMLNYVFRYAKAISYGEGFEFRKMGKMDPKPETLFCAIRVSRVLDPASDRIGVALVRFFAALWHEVPGTRHVLLIIDCHVYCCRAVLFLSRGVAGRFYVFTVVLPFRTKQRGSDFQVYHVSFEKGSIFRMNRVRNRYEGNWLPSTNFKLILLYKLFSK